MRAVGARMSVYCGTPNKVSARTPKGKIRLRGEQDSLTVRETLTSPTRKTPHLYYCNNDWETLGDTYGLEVDTERREDNEFDFNNGQSFRERIRVKDTEKTLVGGEWGDQFHVAFINGEKPVLIQIKCKDDNLFETKETSCNNNNENNAKGKLDNKDVYLMYYIEAEGTENE